MNKKLRKYLIHSLKHHLPIGSGGIIVGIMWTANKIETNFLSELTGNTEALKQCMDIVQSVSPL